MGQVIGSLLQTRKIWAEFTLPASVSISKASELLASDPVNGVLLLLLNFLLCFNL